MRTTLSVLLAASLLANGVIAWRLWAAHQPAATELFVAPAPAAPATPPPPPPPPLGEQLRTDDPAELTARLRAIGLPPSLLNAVVSNRLHRALNHRLRDLRNENSEDGYWTGTPDLNPDQRRAIIQLQSEIETQLRELLGDDYRNDPIRIAELQRRYGPIDPAKLPRLEAIISDYQSLAASYTVTMFELPGDVETLTLIQQEQQRDLAALLSPSELLEFNVRNDPAAHRLRQSLGVMQPTEAEFRQLLPLWQQMPVGNEPRRVMNTVAASSPEELAAREALIAQVSTLFGPERAAALNQALTPQASMENAFAARVGLPASAARSLYHTRLAAQELLQTSSGNPAAATQAQTMLDEITATIDADNLTLYRNVFGGWINGLESLASTPPSPPTPDAGG